MEKLSSKHADMRLAFGVLSEAKTSIKMGEMEILFAPPCFGVYQLFSREIKPIAVEDLNCYDLEFIYNPLSIMLFGKNDIPEWFITFFNNLTFQDLLKILQLVKDSIQINEIYTMYGLDKIRELERKESEKDKKQLRSGIKKVNYWEMIGNIVKYWGISFNEAIWELSYQNVVLMNMSIPKHDKEGNKLEAPSEITGKQFIQKLKTKKEESK